MRKFYTIIACLGFFISAQAQTQVVVFDKQGDNTWKVPCGVSSVTVEVWGAGGAGGGAKKKSVEKAGGGAGGSYVKGTFSVVSGQSLGVYVGQGGLGKNKGDGEDGESSWFKSKTTLLAVGGKGADKVSGNNKEGAGAAARTSGNINTGSSPISLYGEAGVTSTSGLSGRGGNAAGSGGTGGAGIGASNDGKNGDAPGGGGSGGYASDDNDRKGGRGGDGKVVITYDGVPFGYCAAAFKKVQPITLVQFAGINNSSSNSMSSPVYESFCITGSVNQGSSYSITLMGNTNDTYIDWGFGGFWLTNNKVYFTVFVDWNQDGDFDDAGERINITTSPGYITRSNGNDGISISQNITVPTDAALGKTRMRIVSELDGYVENACETTSKNNFGQIEDYTIEVSGGCKQPTAATADNSSPLTICAGSPVTLRQTGGQLGPGQVWKWYLNNSAGALVGTTSNSDASFNVSPAANTTYYVRAEGGSCGSNGTGVAVVVNVNQPATINLTSGNKDFSICANSGAITPIVFTVGGGATNASASGLPAGLTGSYNATNKTYTITGTPTTPGTFNFTVVTVGGSPCANASLTGTINVLAELSGLNYLLPTAVYCTGGNIVPNVPSFSKGVATSFTVSPALPAGLSLNASTGVISGAPTAIQGATNYTITASNGFCSVTKVISITVSNTGSQIFNVQPNGTSVICSDGSVSISLDGSEAGKSYQLYRNGVATGGAVAGTGSAISMGIQSIAGVYTVATIGGCTTGMNGTVTIQVTAKPNTQFTYSKYSFCKDEGTSGQANITGTPLSGGVFSASPGGLVFVNTSTGEIDLANSAAGNYTVTYSIAASGGCALYTYSKSVTIHPTATLYSINGGGSYCAGTGGLPITLSGSQAGISYQLYRDGSAVGGVVAGTGSAISFGNQTVAGNYYVVATDACQTEMNGSVTITVKPAPTAPVITANITTICQGTVLPLIASAGAPTKITSSKTFSSGNMNISIPDNNANGAYIPLVVSGIPANAVISQVTVTFNITHGDTRQLVVNLKGPNNNVLNVANGLGTNSNKKNFTNTNIDLTSTSSITSGTAPFTGTYKAQGSIGVAGAAYVINNVSNAAQLDDLLEGNGLGANGVWNLSVKDIVNSTTGTFNNWTIKVDYSTITNSTQVTWTSQTDLYQDPAALNGYVINSSLDQVFLKPSSAGNKNYTATSTNEFGCSTSSSVAINVLVSPSLKLTADYCADIKNNKIVITATDTDGSGINLNSWKWSSGYDEAPTNSTTNSIIKTKTSGSFYVSALGTNGCYAQGSIGVAQELVVNGDFEAGNDGSFYTEYAYVTGKGNTLVPEGTFTIDNSPNDYHNNFWGADHTKADGTGKFMIVNGYPNSSNKVIWRQTVTVLPNTTYYFSAYAVSLNDVAPYANLSFRVNGVTVGTPTGALLSKDRNNYPGNWTRFYGTWASNSATTAVIEIVNLQPAPEGNDFGLDDISFGTLSTFFNVKSELPTTTQVLCANSDLSMIAYEYGGQGTPPALTWSASNPGGISTYSDGREYKMVGKPTTPGTYSYNLSLAVCKDKSGKDQYLVKTGTLEVKQPSDPGTFKDAVGNAIALCYNSSGVVKLQNTFGSITKWEASNDQATWSPISNTTTSHAYNNLVDPLYLRAYAQQLDVNGVAIKGCNEKVSQVLKLGIKNMWEGNNTGAWNIAGNWSFSTIPTSDCDYVIIPDVGGKPYPVLSDARQVNNLIIRNNAHVTVNNEGTLKISGAISNVGSGYIDSRLGTLEFNGASAQSISSSVLKDTTVNKLVVSNSAGLTVSPLGKALAVAGKISFGTANAKLYTGDNVALKSTKAHTASLGQVGPSNVVSGKLTVERYINVGKATGEHDKKWIIVAPNTNGQTIKESWMEGTPGNFASTGYGIMLSGPEGTAGGWDMSSPSPAIKSYVQSTGQGSWAGAPGSYVNLNTQSAWMVFVRGDRSVTGQWDSPKPTTLRSKGTVTTGTKTINVPAKSDGFYLIGNPYPSAIDISKVQGLGTTGTYYIWNPNLGGDYGLGAYQTFSYVDGNYFAVPRKAGKPDTVNNNLQSGQGFFVQSTATPFNIVFNEGAKVDVSDNVSFMRGARREDEKVRTLRTNINLADGSLQDGVLQIFGSDYSNSVDMADGRKLLNTGVNLSIKVADKQLAVERRQPLTMKDTIFLNLTGASNGQYSFDFEAEGLADFGLEGWLEDAFTGKRTAVKMEGITTTSFEITSASPSKAANRFRIVFQAAFAPMPVTFVKVEAVKEGNDVRVKWNVANEINLKNYVVMRSADGTNFSDLSSVNAAGQKEYSITDLQPLYGYNYYKIRSVDKDGSVAYSTIVKVAMGQGNATISVFPNPIVNGVVNVRLENMPAGKYGIRLLNPGGQVMLTREVNHAGGTYNERLPWDYKMAHGTYQLEVHKPDGGTKVITVMY